MAICVKKRKKQEKKQHLIAAAAKVCNAPAPVITTVAQKQ